MDRVKLGNVLKASGKVTRSTFHKLSALRKARKSADATKGKLRSIRYPRTVERVSPKMIGQDRSKLLYILAIDLIPNPKASSPGPVVPIQRLDPVIENEARARTKKAIFDISRKMGVVPAEEYFEAIPLVTLEGPDSGVESIGLASSDDEEWGEASASAQTPATMTSPCPTPSSASSSDEEFERILTETQSNILSDEEELERDAFPDPAMVSSDDEELEGPPAFQTPVCSASSDGQLEVVSTPNPNGLSKYANDCKQVSRSFQKMGACSAKVKPWLKCRNSRILQNLDPKMEGDLWNSRKPAKRPCFPPRRSGLFSEVFSFAQQRTPIGN